VNAAQALLLEQASWPAAQRADAIAALAPGHEEEPVAVAYAGVDDFLRDAAPALIPIATAAGERLLLVRRGGRATLDVVDPSLARRRIAAALVREAMRAPLEAPRIAETERVLAAAQVAGGRRRRARAALLAEALAGQRIEGASVLRLPIGAPRAVLARDLRLGPRLRRLLLLHGVEQALGLAAWWVVGRGALEGRLDRGWLAAFGLLLLTLVPLAMQRTSWAGRLAIDAGMALKRRLLAGALALDAEETRRDGVGRFLSRVLESEAVESLAIGGGLLALLALVELATAFGLLALGAQSGLLAGALLLWIGVTLLVARAVGRRRARWTEARLDLTHGLVESMTGHRTRLAQEPPSRRHDTEDRELERYGQESTRFDGAARAMALLPRGWLVVGLLGLAPRFLTGGESPARLAVALGALLVAWRAFAAFAAGVSDLLGAGISWRLVARLFAAAESTTPAVAPSVPPPAAAPDEPILTGLDLAYRHRDRGEPVLRAVDLAIARGDRLLLEGPSGSGKSTLCSLLSGLRTPDSGLLLLRGLDLATHGAREWRRAVVAAPQFHENHVLSNTLAFNLLLGRAWPPQERDLEKAEQLCGELGLAPLLARMPSGLQQMVGESGWQLSHGEKSRLYLARALLQEPELVLLDESFAALDPETLREVVACVDRHAPALLVVAHP